MKIVRLEAEQFKRLRAVHITPDGAVVEIRGANGQGKSSCLDAIAAALGGERLCPEVPIRRGQKTAKVEVELDDGMVATRKWTEKGSYLEVKSKEGMSFKSPQKILDALTGALSFDPLAFLREKPERQAEVLRQLIGVDFSLLDGKRKTAFDARTEVNRRAAMHKARLSGMPVVEAPDAPVSAADLMAEQERRRAQHEGNEAKRRILAAARQKYLDIEKKLEADRAEIARLERLLAEAKALLDVDQQDLAAAADHGKTLRAEVEALPEPNLEEIPAQIREVDAINDRVRQKQSRAEEARALAAAEEESARLTKELDAIDAQKTAAISEAKFPVDGLGFGETGVTLNGLPFGQASSAEQLRVSVATGIALNPRLKVLLIRDGSLLDANSLALVQKMAAEADSQVWLEIVSTTGQGGILIEDGAVDGVVPAEEEALDLKRGQFPVLDEVKGETVVMGAPREE